MRGGEGVGQVKIIFLKIDVGQVAGLCRFKQVLCGRLQVIRCILHICL